MVALLKRAMTSIAPTKKGTTDMPALNFMKRFAPWVESGVKWTTIRAPRKDGREICRAGDTLSLYTGMRRRGCRKLGEAACKSVESIRIERSGVTRIGHRRLTRHEKYWLAIGDGFKDFDEILAWFRDVHGLPFRGYLIRWGELR